MRNAKFSAPAIVTVIIFTGINKDIVKQTIFKYLFMTNV